MKILVANPPGLKVNADGTYTRYIKAGSRWSMSVGKKIVENKMPAYLPFPFFLAYTSSLLKSQKIAEVKGVDGVALGLSDERFLDFVRAYSPDLLVIETPTVTIRDDLLLAKRVKDNTGARIVVTGFHVSALPKETMVQASWIDFCCIGEYEETVLELVQALEEDKPLGSVAGLVWRDGSIVHTNPRRALIDVNTLPWPDREDFPPRRYRDFTFREPCVQIVSSRGCPSSCIFCQERWVLYNSPVYRRRDAKNVVDEMEFCIQRYGAKQFYFDDMSIVVSKKHVLEICNEILRRGLDIPWTCMGDAMYVDRETLLKMRSAGCIGMKYGVETANPEILAKIGKPLKLEKVREVNRWLKELGIWSHATFTMGLPGENRQHIEKTIKFALELASDSVQFSIAIPFPGTPFYKWADQQGYLLTKDWCMYDGSCSRVLSTPEISASALEELLMKANETWWRSRYTGSLSYVIRNPIESLRMMMHRVHREGVFLTVRFIGKSFARGIKR
ncbi:MAG: radical SAM protein [Candidatus Bathyarchaeia archaeon]